MLILVSVAEFIFFKMCASRLALGTVQFGLAYGVSNAEGQVSIEQAIAILDAAYKSGVDTLDTAIAYGDSEQRLGEIGVDHWKIITKLPAINKTGKKIEAWVRDSIENSLKKLKVNKLHGVLLHRSQQLLEPDGAVLYKTLQQLKQQGLIERVGVSIYNPEELDALWDRYPLDLVQAPYNLIDRRLKSSGWLEKLTASGVAVHVRSTFLQGLLLMPAQQRPNYFLPWNGLLNRWHQWLHQSGLTSVQAALGFVLQEKKIDRVVVGVLNKQQLNELLMVNVELNDQWPDIRSEDQYLINPACWKLS